ncbi:MAG: DKNYY domain-containing protein [bacterium]|nr:DKNYY domain-containing protein [bacterium]
MENSQKAMPTGPLRRSFSEASRQGFVSPLLIALVALILVGGGVYVYGQNKQANQPAIARLATQATPAPTAIGVGEFLAGPDSINNRVLNYSKDATHAYYKGILIPNADSTTIKVIVNSAYSHEYAKDNARVYYHSDEIIGADPATFKTFATQPYEGPANGPYGVDSAHVFYEANLLPEADRGTFKMQQENYASDKSHVFLNGKVIPNADPKTFKYPELIYG